MQFILQELTTVRQFQQANVAVKGSLNVAEATTYFANCYEISGQVDLQTRIMYANEVLALYGPKVGPDPIPPSAPLEI